MEHKRRDVVIIGGGIMGSAVAYYLMHFESGLKVAVVEFVPAFDTLKLLRGWAGLYAGPDSGKKASFRNRPCLRVEFL